MSIATEITRLNNAKASIKSAIEAKGVEVPQDAKIDSYSGYIEQIPQAQGDKYEPICFTSLEDGNTFKLNRKMSISVDGKKTWQTLKADTFSPVINTGEKIYFKATENEIPFEGQFSYLNFTTAKTCNVSGHPYSLYAKFSEYRFFGLFRDTLIVDASGLDLSENALVPSCYSNMFYGCTSLVTAPELPSTKLAEYCYSNMFYGCTSLVTAPELPATELVGYCYEYMFYGCTSLVKAPELPAIYLDSKCYSHMFYGCRKLNYIKALFKTVPSSNYTDYWVSGVASTGTFVKNSVATWTETGDYAVPTGWKIVKVNA